LNNQQLRLAALVLLIAPTFGQNVTCRVNHRNLMSKPKEFQESDYSNDGSNIVFKRQRKYHWISMSIISYQIPKNPGFAVYLLPIL
jgi:hypothetical protein